MKTKFIIFFCFFSSSIIFGQNAENSKLNKDFFTTEQAFDKIKEYILNNNSNALWELYKDTDVPPKNMFAEFLGKKTTDNRKMTFEEFTALIKEIYTFTQENNIKNFNFGNLLDQNSVMSTRVSISSGVHSSTETIKKCAALTPLYFNVSSVENFPSVSTISETKYNVYVEIEKKDTIGFRITSIYTETNYLEKDFDLFEYIKNNFANTEDYIIDIMAFKPKQRMSYSFIRQASKKDIEIINKLKILNYEESYKTLKVSELYSYCIMNSNQSKYAALIFSEINNIVLIVVDGKYGLFQIDNIKLLIKKLNKEK